MSNFFTYLKTKSFRNTFLSILGVGLVLLITAFFSLRYYTKHGEGLNVPQVKGLSVIEAINQLEALGLRYEIDSVYIMDKAPGIVTDQEPIMGTFVKENRTIYLTINATQAPNIKFPDVEFKTLREARAILESYRLKIGDTVYKPDVSRDVVLEAFYAGRKIARGESLPSGSRIDLVLGDGRGNEDIELPNIIGLTIDEAKFALKGSMLSLGTINSDGLITDSANAVIVSQFPLTADTVVKVKIGSQVQVTISNKRRY